MKKYEKATLVFLSFISKTAISNIKLDEYLIANGRSEDDIVKRNSYTSAS